MVTRMLFPQGGSADSLSDSRIEPRYKTNLVARVVAEDGAIVSARLTNISCHGLQLRGDHRLLQTLMPNRGPHRPIDAITFDVSFEVPTSEVVAAPIGIRCQLIYTRRLAQNAFMVGCQFLAFENDCDQPLLDFISHFAEPE